MTRSARFLVVLLAAVAGPACAPRYATKPPLAFAELPYRGPDGREWPVQHLSIPETARAYGMDAVPKVAVVELNRGGPKGTIVFLHGLGSYLKFWWYQLDAFASDGWHVVALDQPGYGKSDKPASFPYTMEAMADVAREVARHLGVEKPVVAGHSMGGQTALSWAVRYPEEVRALVLTSPAGFETFTAREKTWFKKNFTSTLVTKPGEYAIRGSVRANNFANWRDELEWLVEERVRVAKAPGFDRYAYAQVRSVQGLSENDFVRQSLGQVKAPTIVVFGEDDRLIPNPFLHGGRPRAIFERGAKAIPNARLVGLDGCGHSVQLDCPERYGDAVKAFLGTLEAP
jgi:pimeloyl-ACP methyl ester carboxylesterase